MGTSWRVEGPLDIALQEEVMDLALVPTVDCFAQLSLAPSQSCLRYRNASPQADLFLQRISARH